MLELVYSAVLEIAIPLTEYVGSKPTWRIKQEWWNRRHVRLKSECRLTRRGGSTPPSCNAVCLGGEIWNTRSSQERVLLNGHEGSIPSLSIRLILESVSSSEIFSGCVAVVA